jgi:hypothetical protein
VVSCSTKIRFCFSLIINYHQQLNVSKLLQCHRGVQQTYGVLAYYTWFQKKVNQYHTRVFQVFCMDFRLWWDITCVMT